MEKVLIFAFSVTLLFSLFKVLEMKYITKETEPLKNIVREAVFVFISSIISGYFVLEFGGSIEGLVNTITDNKVLNAATTQIFVGPPDF